MLQLQIFVQSSSNGQNEHIHLTHHRYFILGYRMLFKCYTALCNDISTLYNINPWECVLENPREENLTKEGLH